MVTRRQVLTSLTATTIAAWNRRSSAAADVPQPRTAVNFAVPPNACDTHVHVFGDEARYPYAPTTGYRHPPATPEDLRALLRALHLSRVVIIQPSAYGTDNTCTLDGVAALGLANARAVVAIDGNTPDAELDRLDRAGARGVRVNAGRTAESAREQLSKMASRLAGRGWHINTAIQMPVLEPLADLLTNSRVPIVIDHFANAQASGGVAQPGFAQLVSLLKNGNIYLKISRVPNISTAAPDYADAATVARALISANPQRILWGTDWPHAGGRPGYTAAQISPYQDLDDGRIFNQLPIWAPDPAHREMILVQNPARLYGF